MEDNEGDVKGYIIYREESEEDLKRKKEEEAKLKELIKQQLAEGNDTQMIEEQEEDTGALNEQVAAIIKKFKGKILMEFIPHFMLNQYKDE